MRRSTKNNITKRIIFGLAVALLIVGCSKDQQFEEGNGIVGGAEKNMTYVKFAIESGDFTKAIIANPDEIIRQTKIYIFVSDTLYNTMSNVSALTTPTVMVPVGKGRVVAIANINQYDGTNSNWGSDNALPAINVGDSYSTFIAALQSVKVNNNYMTTPYETGLNISNITKPDTNYAGLVMYSNVIFDFPKDGTEAAAMPITLSLERAASIVSVVWGDYFGLANNNMITDRKHVLGYFTEDISFTAMNTPNTIPIARERGQGIDKFSPTNSITASTNAEKINALAANLVGYDKMKLDLGSDLSTTALVNNAYTMAKVLAAPSLPWENINHIIPENIVNGLAEGGSIADGEVSYVVIRAKYIPTYSQIGDLGSEFCNISWNDGAGNSYEAPAGDGNRAADGTFYAIRRKGEKSLLLRAYDNIGFFFTKENAEGYIKNFLFQLYPESFTGTQDVNDFEVVKFDKGYMYYRVNLTNNAYPDDARKRFSVLNNSKYTLTVNNIREYGTHSVEELAEEPLAPINENTKFPLSAEVKMYSYIIVDSDISLAE